MKHFLKAFWAKSLEKDSLKSNYYEEDCIIKNVYIYENIIC